MGVYELLLIVQYCRDIRKAAHQLGLVGSGDELPRAKKKKLSVCNQEPEYVQNRCLVPYSFC